MNQVNKYKDYKKISIRNNNLMTKRQHGHFKDITIDFMKNAVPSLNYGAYSAKSITKNGHKFVVNSINKINLKNHEKENAEWFLNLMGGKIIYLPDINTKDSVKMADYKYIPIKGKWYFLENKEIILNEQQLKAGINNIFHKIEESINQSNVFLIDVTNGKLTNKEIMERLDVVYRHPKLKNINKTLIVKKGYNLFGVFKEK